jgi:hypothetical protein
VFLTIWALVTPFKVIYLSGRIGFAITIYAGLWYLHYPGMLLLLSETYSTLYAILMLPFCAPGLAMAGLVWHESRDEHFTRLQYYGLIVILYVLQILLTFVLPCMNSRALCVPTPTTGIVALFFISRVVKEPTVPWSGAVSDNQAFTHEMTED